MVLRTALLLSIPLILIASHGPARAGDGVHEVRVVHGLRFEMTVPGRFYPQNALVPVTVIMRNISSRSVQLRKTCGYGYLWIEVTDQRGHVLYPPAIPTAPPPTCSGPVARTEFRPGQTTQRSLVALVRGTHLRVVASLASGMISGPAMTIRLIHGTPPTVTPSTSGPYQAAIVPAGPVHGPLYFATFTNCYLGITNVLTTLPANRTEWNVTAGRVVAPALCKSDVYGTVSWQLVAGWIGQPAVIWESR